MRSWRLAGGAALLLAGVSPEAWAGEGEPWREALPARALERPVVLPRGWTELALDHQWGRVLDEQGAVQRLRRARLALRHGLVRRLEVSLAGEALGHQGGGPPYATVGGQVRFSLFDREPPRQALALQFGADLPLSRRVGTYHLDQGGLRLGTGAPTAELALVARQELSPVVLDLRVGHTFRAPGDASGLVAEPPTALVRERPGGLGAGELGLGVQLGPLFPSLAVRGVYRGPGELEGSQGSMAVASGAWLALDAGLGLHLSRGLELQAGVVGRLWGTDDPRPGDLSTGPPPGRGFTLSTVLRH